MSGKSSKLLRKLGRGSAIKKVKQMYQSLDWVHKTKFNESLKLFIKEKHDSTIQKN